MNRIYRIFGLFTAALMFALASGAAFGADKTYQLTISAGATSPTPVTATLTSKGNSSFNSFTLTLPAGYSLVGTPTISASKGNVSYNPATRLVTVLDIGLPVGSGSNEVITVTMSNVATTGADCASGVAGNWTASVWTGSALNGSPFSAVAPYPVSTSIKPLCYTATPSFGTGGSMTPSTPQTVAVNGKVSFTVTPDSANGYHITSVTGCGVTKTSGDGDLVASDYQTAAMTGNCTVSATFALKTYTVTYSAGNGGTINPSGSSTVTWGATPTFTVTPNSTPNNYSIDSVSASPAGCSAALQAGGGDGKFMPSTYKAGAVTQNCTFTASFVPNTLTITSQPTSAAVGTPFDVKVSATPGPATVSFAAGCAASASKASSGNTTTFTVTITDPPASGTCTMTFTAPNYDTITLNSLKVYNGVLGCNTNPAPDFPPNPLAAGYFTGSPSGVTAVTQPGFAAGYRVQNKNDETCYLVNYTFTNNILGGGNATDSFGNTLPPNAASHVWDEAFQPHAAYVYVLTFKPEYVDAISGLPSNKTKFCDAGAGNTDCTIAGNQKVLKACIGTALSYLSIPGDDPACSIEETWIGVPTSECGTDTNRACVRPSVRILDARDPPIIRG